MFAERFSLEPIQLERLKTHKYSSEGSSVLERFMQPYWKWLVTTIPLWLAPNLITFIGLLVNVLTSVPVVFLDPNAQGVAPSWAYIFCSIGFFVYQSLDAIDGKQARRIGMNTPLGELFDHGCDAISVFLVVITAISAIAVHSTPLIMLGFIVLLMVLNFCYHWQTYVCGTLHFKLIDVTEAQFVHMFVLLIAGSFGDDLWLYRVPYIDVTLKSVLIFIVYSVSIFNGITTFHVILTCGVGKNGSTVADTSVLSPLIILLFHVPVIGMYTYISSDPLNEYCMLFFAAMAFPLVKSTINIMVATMTRSPLALLDSIMLGPLLAFTNVYFGSWLPEKYLLLAIAIYNVADVMLMCISLCQQICNSLGITCFTVPSPQKGKDIAQ